MQARETLLAALPVTQRRLDLAGISTAILEGGNGPTVMLLHGPGANATHWLGVLPELASTHHVVVPDLPGQGASEITCRPLNADRVLSWLGELIESTCATPPTLVGYALGGAIAARFAADRGDRLHRLVLVDTLGLSEFEPPPDFGLALHDFLTQPSDHTHDQLWRFCAADLTRLRRRMGELWEPFRAYNVECARRPTVQQALGTLMAQFGGPPIPPADLARITVPTNLVWGRHDLATPVRTAEAVSGRYGWPLQVIEHCGDDPPVEAPQALLRAVLDTTLTDEIVDGLRERLHGPLRTPQDVGFADATQLWNGMITTKPAMVITAAATADVVEAVRCAREHGLALSVRGGGHNIAGTALAGGGLTLDMSGLRDITVDPGAQTATVQAGCLLGELDRATQEYGLATPLGFISKVGVAGLTLGGGLGYLTRRFGWTVDNLLEVEIITADGHVRRASRDEHADLFWAIRGAGANFGVVTSFTFRLHEVGPSVYGGLIAWPGERVHEIMRAYRTITTQAPRELAVWLVLMNAPPAPFVPQQWHGKKICAMAVCYTGDLSRTDHVVAPIRAIGDPIVDLLAEQPYTQVQSYLDDGEPQGMHYYWKTDYAAELSDELLDLTQKLFADCPIPGIECGFLHVGGDINDHDEDDGAVGNRNARYIIGANGMWAPGEPRAAEYREWIRDAWTQLHPFSTGRTYVNFQTADEGSDRVQASYGINFDRLVEIKKVYDPNNLFRSNRNIRTLRSVDVRIKSCSPGRPGAR
jgi:pimeloyl-ACP methyl ester carboxylesterase/UDP-N-acetylenolpyruvoylglucosamine reductase